MRKKISAIWTNKFTIPKNIKYLKQMIKKAKC